MRKIKITLLLLTTTIAANAQLTITGEIRPRTEFRNGFKKLRGTGDKAAFFTEQRSRLYFDYKAKNYEFKLALQDVRIWGQSNQILKYESVPTSFLSEAWGKLYITPKLGIKVGRQMISYDNQRFLGGLEWAQQGRRHDAAVIMYEDKEGSKLKVHAGFAFNQSADVIEPKKLSGTAYLTKVNNYKVMQYLWANKDFGKTKVSLLFFNEGRDYYGIDTLNGKKDTSELSLAYQQTIGGVIKHKFSDKLFFGGEGYFQTGKSRGALVNNSFSLLQPKVSAFMFDANLTYNFTNTKSTTTPITLGYQYLSGRDQNETSTDIKQFNPAYGTNHAHNGYMDYFYVGNGHGNVGLQDIYLKTKFKLSKKSILMANVHYFSAAAKVLDETAKEMPGYLGTELDLVYKYTLSKQAFVHIGYSHMLASKTMTRLKGGDEGVIQNWAWVMFTFKPTLFKSKAIAEK